jgi:hypothetical protein
VVGEDVAGGDRAAEVPGAEQRDVVLAGGAQDLADLREPTPRLPNLPNPERSRRICVEFTCV